MDSPYNETITKQLLLYIYTDPAFASFRRICQNSVTSYKERKEASAKYNNLNPRDLSDTPTKPDTPVIRS